MMKKINKYKYSKKTKKSPVIELVMTLVLIVIVITGIQDTVFPNQTIEDVKLIACVDGDTAKLRINGENETVRFLAIDTPETKHPTKGIEPFGKEASDFTCNSLNRASEIRVEFDANSEYRDKYNRILAWVFVDGKLLQEEIIKNGLGRIAYLYGNYSFLDKLNEAERYAQSNSLGIWK